MEAQLCGKSARWTCSIIEDRVRQAKSTSSREHVFSSIWEVFADTLASPFPLRDGAAQTLTELSRRGIGLALVSKRGGRAGSLPLNELRSTGLDALFKFVRVGVDLREYGMVLNEALEVLRAEAQETVVVSDWCKDIEYAKNSGLTAIGILGGVSEADEHRNAGADWVIEYLSEIPRVL